MPFYGISQLAQSCQEQGGGQLAYHVLKNVTVSATGNILDKNTKLSLFWNMFRHIEDFNSSHREIPELWTNHVWRKHLRHFAVNGTDLCIAFQHQP